MESVENLMRDCKVRDRQTKAEGKTECLLSNVSSSQISNVRNPLFAAGFGINFPLLQALKPFSRIKRATFL
jgi:hypothetical protein